MAEKSASRDSDSSWVLAGSEGLQVDTVGPELDSVSHGAEDEELEKKGSSQDTDAGAGVLLALWGRVTSQHLCPQDQDPKAGAVPTPDGSVEPCVPDGGEQEEPHAEVEPSPCPDTPKAGEAHGGRQQEGGHAGRAGVQTLPVGLPRPSPGPPTEEGSCSSSEDDLEGLRRRQGHEPRPGPPLPTPALHRGAPDAGDVEGLSMSKYLLGALALVAVGLLIVSGGIYDPVDGPLEAVVSRDVVMGEPESPLPADSNDSHQKPPVSDTRDPQSLQSVSLLLDKLAKENQEIRLMQAELQAHKEELQALLQKSEGAAAAAGAQQQSLAAENQRLQAALEQEAAALRDARAELQRLRAAGALGSSGARQPAAEQPPGAGAPSRGEDAARREGARRHGWLASVQQELASVLERARRPGGLEGLVEELSALEQRLGQELEAEPFAGSWKKPFKAEKKESKRYKRHGAGPPPHEREKREQGKPHGHGKDSRHPREHKQGKSWGKSSHGPPQRGPRELFSQYRAPQGCSGVADCARKEGRELLGAALEPVQKAEFLRLLEGFMGRLGWGRRFEGLAARLDGAFGADGSFAHDRLRFVDFVDDVEELLEEVARQERGDEEAADDFEEFVLRHYAGDGSTSRKEWDRRAPREHGARG
ncbi:pre-B-cell leukemia transcription factor-interacting protein 1 [Dryobates pubescens]|uniref:pre-B-cell leukemia transcription factor-interacting protein 1 n=1 Tax=Dryobates pubescens TaxID=118200 RepID=UPI0023BA331E|nr:pre-B-cell leukemia transcription factor-interacting protein 1 [Dryobates pubescens]